MCQVFIFIPLPTSISYGEQKWRNWSEEGPKTLLDPMSCYWTNMEPLTSLSSPTIPLLCQEWLIMSKGLSRQFFRQVSKYQEDANSWWGKMVCKASPCGWLTKSFIHPTGGVASCEPIVRNPDYYSEGRTSPLLFLSSGLLTLKVWWLILLQIVFFGAPA